MGGLKGSNFGGHAPVTNADIYLFQVGVNGYSSAATSLLTASYDATQGFPTADNSASDPGVPSGAYSVQSDSSGSFYVSDYSCTPGYPVYLAGVAGSTTSGGTFTVKGYTGTRRGSAVFTIPAGQNAILYVGQQVSFPTTLNGITNPATITATTVPTATANGSFTVAYGNVASVTNTTYTGPITPVGVANPATINLAVLGNCPSSGNFYSGSTAISYVYMNEVSTVAAALSLGGFGSGPFNIGIPNNGTANVPDPLALVGIQNAALNANQIFDITGSSVSTTYQGEGHIARAFTPAGNGIVPRALVDTLGNILAACVDSANTSGTTSTPCATLFANATLTGATTGTKPTDIATAAFNIAHHPSGPAGGSSANGGGSGTSYYFVNQLYTLQGTTSPFAPNLTTQPADFTAAIQYPLTTNGTTNPVNEAESIGVDADGSIWINSAGARQIIKFSPQGVVQYTSPTSAYSYGYLSIDPSGNVWTGSTFTDTRETEFVGSGTTYTPTLLNGPTSNGFTGSTIYDGYITVTDGSGNAYVGATPPTGATGNTTQWYTVKYGPGGTGPTSVNMSASIPANYVVAHGAVDSAGFVWWTTETNATNTTGWAVTRIDPATGTASGGFPVHNLTTIGTGTRNAAILAPEMPSIDSGGNLWVANQNAGNNGSVMKITSGAAVTTASGALVDGPFGVSVDGAGNVWVANRSTGTAANRSLIEYSSAGTAISPTANYALGFTSGNFPAPLNLAVDQSGVVWITSYDNSSLMELLGPGAPTYNPISSGIAAGKLGAKP